MNNIGLSRRELLKAMAAGTVLMGTDILFFDAKPLDATTKEGYEPPLPNIDVGGLIRPPGALPEKDFRAKCISCGVCGNVCHAMKYDAIATAGFNPISPFGNGVLREIWNFGTPYVKKMRDFPCTLCMECPKHCPTGALNKIGKEKVRMGIALIDFSLCLGYNGDVCLSCSKACPLGAKVFDFYYSDWGNQPMINENCVGCGLCDRYCIVGGSAVKVIRLEEYEKVKDDYLKEFKRVITMKHEDRYKEVYDNNIPKILSRGRIMERTYR